MQSPVARSSRPSLSMWLFATAVLVTAVAVTAAATWIDQLVRRQARAEAMHHLDSHAQALRDALDRGMAQQLQQVSLLASLPQIAQPARPADVRVVLDSFKANFPQFAWLGLTDPKGRVLAASGGLLEGVDVSARPWVKGGQEGVFVGDVHRAALLEKLLPAQSEPWRFVDFALPITDARGQLRGVLGAHLSWQWTAGVKQELSDRLALEQGVEALVLGASGEVLLGPQGTEGHLLQPGAPGYLWAQARSVGHGGFHGLGWTMVLRQPESLSMAPYAQLHAQTILGALAVCLLATPLLWWIARRLSAPLIGLTHALQEPVFGERPAGAMPYREADLLQQALARYDARQHEQAAELKHWARSLEQRVADRTAALAESERRLAGVLGNIPAMVGHFDRDERCLFANELALKVHGLTREQALGRRLSDGISRKAYALHEPYVRQVLAGKRVSFEGEEPKSRQFSHYQVNLVPEQDAQGKVTGFFLMTFDVTALKQAQEQLKRNELRLRAIADSLREAERRMADLALNDALTGLANRRRLDERLPEALGRARRNRSGTALFFLDIDRFKSINDSHGHAIGDAVLVEFARRLTGALRATDFVARQAGDEFVAVLEGLHGVQEAELVARKVVEAVRPPMHTAAGALDVTTSLGVAFLPAGVVRAPEALLALADQALYRTKQRGRDGYTCIEAEREPVTLQLARSGAA